MPDRNRLARPAPIVILLVLVSLVLYRPTVVSLYQIWTNPNNPTYSHGLLLVAVSVVLFYRQWKRGHFELNPSPWGLLALAVTSLVWLLAYLGQVQIIQQFSLLGMIGLLLWTLLGYRNAKKLAFPVLLLLFAIPFWEFVSVPLQYFTANAVTLLLNNTGFTAVLDDVFILVPAGTFEVSTDCSGVAQFIVAMMVAALYSHINEIRPGKALLLTAVATLVAIASNTLRIYIVVVSGQLTNMQHYFVTKDHFTLGWILFGIGMFVFLLWANRYVAHETNMVAKVAKPEQRSLSGLLVPSNPDQRSTTVVALRTTALAFGALALGPVLAHGYAVRGPTSAPTLAIPAQLGHWQATGAATDGYRPHFYGADVEYDTLYQGVDGVNVYLFVAYYARQEQGKEAVYYRNRVYDDRSWQRISTEERDVSAGSGGISRVRETRVRSRDGSIKIIWQWYYARGWRTSNDYMAKLSTLWGTLNNDPSMAAIVVAADLEGSTSKSRAVLKRFLSDNMQAIEQAIDGVRGS